MERGIMLVMNENEVLTRLWKIKDYVLCFDDLTH